MKITHVIHTFPPDSRAGSENYLEALATQQAERHSVSVFHRVADVERDEYEVTTHRQGPLDITRINRTFRDLEDFRGTYRCDGVAQRFAAYLDEYRPDIVHFHHITCLSTTCVHEARARGIVVVFTLHDFWLLCPRGQLMRHDLSLCTGHNPTDCVRCMAHQLPVSGGPERIEELRNRAARLKRWRLPERIHRRLASAPFGKEKAAVEAIRVRESDMLEMCGLVDQFIAPSSFLGDQYQRFGVQADRILVSDYGFDTSIWETAVSRPDEVPGTLRFAYLGTWIPSKGVHVLIEAFRRMTPAHAVLDIHGYEVPFEGFPGYEEHLRELAGDAPHIRFRSRYEPDEVPTLLSRADVLVVPSIWYENSPLTIHEAFLAGIPVIASDSGGMKELVRDGVNGLTFRLGDAGSLFEAMKKIVDDPALLARLQQERTSVKTIEEDSLETEELYRRLLAEGPRSP